MKKLLLLLSFVVFTTLSFAQDLHIGRTLDEITNSSSSKLYMFTIGDRQALHELVDSNTTDIYYFNDYGICIEYDRVYANCCIEVAAQYLNSFDKKGDIYIQPTTGLIAIIQPMSSNLFKIRIKKA